MPDLRATRDDAIYLIENGMRNWPHVPRVSEEDLEDLRGALEWIVDRHRLQAIEECARIASKHYDGHGPALGTTRAYCYEHAGRCIAAALRSKERGE